MTSAELKQIKQDKELTVKDISNHLGVSERQVYRWLSGEAVINRRTAISIRGILS